MEHIVQFGITIDDDKIEQMMMNKASSECLDQISKATKDFSRDDYYGDSQLKTMFREEVKKVVDDNKETIIEQAVKYVSANLMKTKAIMEAKVKLTDSLNN